MSDILTQIKNKAKDITIDLYYKEWDKSFNEFANKYKTLGEIPGFQQYVKNRPDLANQSTASWKSFFAGLAKGESSFRPKAKHGSYKGLYQIGNLDENRLSDYEYQHTEAFKHLGKQALSFLTKDDLALAQGKGYNQSDVLKMAWQQGRHVLNYLYTGTNPTDGNNTNFKSYLNKTYWDDTSVNVYSSLPDADRTTTMKVDKTTRFSPVQDKKRLYGRNFVEAGADLYRGLRNTKGDIDSVKIKRLRGDQGYYLQLGETYDFNNRDITPPVSKKPYRLNTDFAVPQNQKEWETMMKDIDSIKINIMPNIKKFGGKLRYGWGGFADTLDILEGRLQNDGMINNFTGFKQNDNMYVYAHPSGMQPPMQGTTGYPIFTGEGYVRSYDSDSNKFIFTDIDSIPNAGNPIDGDTIYHDVRYLNDYGSKYLTDYNNQYKPLYINMQDRILKDISQQRNLTAQQIARFGGLIGVRRKYPYGGNYVENNIPAYNGYIGWGTEVKPEDIAYSDYEAKGEGIVGSEIANKASMISGIGAGIGTMAGTAAGTALGAWGGPIGMAAGALLGSLIGIFTGRKKRREEEANRRELLAEQQEANRQNTISNMENRYENDVAKIRTATQPTTFSGQSFYSKYGGMIKPRMKYNNGGTILPNSSDTAVAYGRTHEQVDPMTGETGITYGNAEVEGGGLVGGKELPGEVIQQTPNGDRIYSDSLYVPGTRATYAQIAKALTDKKGDIEQEISTLQETLDTSLEAFNKAKLAKAKTGTATRNIEKLAAKLNLKTGELAQVDAKLNDVFTSQEQMATALGLRDTAPVTARFGGYRPKYKFGVAEAGLGMNALSFIGNMIATGLSAKSNQAQLDFMSRLSVPKTNKVEAEYHTIDTSPYEEASRKMAAETKRFNKWIEDNVNNPQVLRNQKRKNLINYYEGLGDINAKKSAYLTSVYDANRNARIAARNANNQGEYQDAVNEYNKNMQIANARISLNNQTTQNYMASINQLMQAVGSYGMQKMYLAQLPKGVQNEFYFGNDSMKNQLGLTNKDIRGLRRAGVDISAMRGAFRQSNNNLDYLLYLLNS